VDLDADVAVVVDVDVIVNVIGPFFGCGSATSAFSVPPWSTFVAMPLDEVGVQ
jgi:hypothetical protein